MIHAICDFCGKDCERNATLIVLKAFSDFARYHYDTSPFGVEEKSKGFVMCSKCLKKHNLPNPYANYQKIDSQKLEYDSYLDNYTEDDFRKDVIAMGKENEKWKK